MAPVADIYAKNNAKHFTNAHKLLPIRQITSKPVRIPNVSKISVSKVSIIKSQNMANKQV